MQYNIIRCTEKEWNKYEFFTVLRYQYKIKLKCVIHSRTFISVYMDKHGLQIISGINQTKKMQFLPISIAAALLAREILETITKHSEPRLLDKIFNEYLLSHSACEWNCWIPVKGPFCCSVTDSLGSWQNIIVYSKNLFLK